MKPAIVFFVLSVVVLTATLVLLSAPGYAQNASKSGGAKPDAESILSAAKNSIGKQMWKDGYGLADGRLGCAASLSNVLKTAGLKNVGSPMTIAVRQKLLKGSLKTAEYTIKDGGDAPINDKTVSAVAKPGDVLVAFMDPLPKGSIGPRAHCGIIGPNGTVFTNDWNDGIWKQGSIHNWFDGYRHIRVIRLQ